MLCESGEQSLNYYFDSVQDSVLRVAAFVEEDLDGLEDEQFARHMENARDYFDMMASKTKRSSDLLLPHRPIGFIDRQRILVHQSERGGL